MLVLSFYFLHGDVAVCLSAHHDVKTFLLAFTGDAVGRVIGCDCGLCVAVRHLPYTVCDALQCEASAVEDAAG